MNKFFQISLYNFLYMLILMLLPVLFFEYVYFSTKIEDYFFRYLILLFYLLLFICLITIKTYLFFIIKKNNYFKALFECFDNNINVKLIGIISAIIFDILAINIVDQNFYIKGIRTFESFHYFTYSFGGVSFSYLSYLILKKQKPLN